MLEWDQTSSAAVPHVFPSELKTQVPSKLQVKGKPFKLLQLEANAGLS